MNPLYETNAGGCFKKKLIIEKILKKLSLSISPSPANILPNECPVVNLPDVKPFFLYYFLKNTKNKIKPLIIVISRIRPLFAKILIFTYAKKHTHHLPKFWFSRNQRNTLIISLQWTQEWENELVITEKGTVDWIQPILEIDNSHTLPFQERSIHQLLHPKAVEQ